MKPERQRRPSLLITPPRLSMRHTSLSSKVTETSRGKSGAQIKYQEEEIGRTSVTDDRGGTDESGLLMTCDRQLQTVLFGQSWDLREHQTQHGCFIHS
jgi:hypothetical protein